jgi:DNA (cytosine-5)-methyltransferase 1
MTHIDLFSGIGGFAYAARQVWPDYRNLFFCDNNTFCQAVLRKNFGSDSLIYGDIREVTVERVAKDTIGGGRAYGEPKEEAAEVRGQRIAGTEDGNGVCDGAAIADTAINVGQSGLPRKDEWGMAHKDKQNVTVDLLTGGFPCQPFSAAGKRKGRDDDRYLWPEMYRVIKAFVPRYIIVENVRGLINIENGMALQQVCLDLESIGYAVQALIIPACAVNAPHRRDRVWIVADNIGRGCEPNRECGSVEAIFGERKNHSMQIEESDRHAADASDEGLQGNERSGTLGQRPGASRPVTEFTWNDNWLEVATRLCRVDDGLPARVDGLELSKSKHREERLKALGNAIVPQVAAEIMRAIRETA